MTNGYYGHRISVGEGSYGSGDNGDITNPTRGDGSNTSTTQTRGSGTNNSTRGGSTNGRTDVTVDNGPEYDDCHYGDVNDYDNDFDYGCNCSHGHDYGNDYSSGYGQNITSQNPYVGNYGNGYQFSQEVYDYYSNANYGAGASANSGTFAKCVKKGAVIGAFIGGPGGATAGAAVGAVVGAAKAVAKWVKGWF